MTTFEPSTWKKAGEVMNTAADDMYRSAYAVITAQPFSAKSSSPIDAAAVAGDALCNVPWHQLVAAANEGMTTTATKMVATGTDYAAAEEAAASTRFWS